MTPAEFWLPVGAAAFYLYDSALLLWQNELVYQRSGRRWIVQGGSAMRLQGRRLFLPNPLLAHRPHFLVCWSKEDPPARAQVGEEPAGFLQAVRPIAILNMLHVLLLVALPVALWSTGAGILALAVFALFYLNTFAALAITWRRRSQFALPAGRFWLLALDCIACAPFAANLTRRLALRHGLAGDPLRFAARHFDDAELARTRALVEARLREEYADPDAAGRGETLLTTVLPRLTR